MTGKSSKKKRLWRFWDSGPRFQTLFDEGRSEEPQGFWSNIDPEVFRHPIRFLTEEWRAPRTRPSLFHYVEDPESRRSEHVSLKELASDLWTGAGGPLFIPGVFSDPQELTLARDQFRTRRMRAGLASLFLHLGGVGVALFLLLRPAAPLPIKDNIVFVSPPFVSPFESTGPDGGGGGGGGKQEKAPPSGGRMPETTRVQFTAPDPEAPLPLVSAEDLLSSAASVQMPIDIAQDTTLPVGDVIPPSDRRSSGPGSGGGIRTG